MNPHGWMVDFFEEIKKKMSPDFDSLRYIVKRNGEYDDYLLGDDISFKFKICNPVISVNFYRMSAGFGESILRDFLKFLEENKIGNYFIQHANPYFRHLMPVGDSAKECWNWFLDIPDMMLGVDGTIFYSEKFIHPLLFTFSFHERKVSVHPHGLEDKKWIASRDEASLFSEEIISLREKIEKKSEEIFAEFQKHDHSSYYQKTENLFVSFGEVIRFEFIKFNHVFQFQIPDWKVTCENEDLDELTREILAAISPHINKRRVRYMLKPR